MSHASSQTSPVLTGGPSSQEPPAAELSELVQFMLGVLARCQAALLQEDSETLQVIRGTLAHLEPAARAAHQHTDAVPCPDAKVSRDVLETWLSAILDRALTEPDQPRTRRELFAALAPPPASAPVLWCRLASLDDLADWFQQFSLHLRATHPRAVEMLQLRFAGLGSRQIADRLQLPFRLVHHVLGEIQGRVTERPRRPETLR